MKPKGLKKWKLLLKDVQLFGNYNSFLSLRFNYEAVAKIVSRNLMKQKDLFLQTQADAFTRMWSAYFRTRIIPMRPLLSTDDC